MSRQDLAQVVRDATDGWGADVVFEVTGVGFSRTVTHMRLAEACRLLRGADLPVSDIC